MKIELALKEDGNVLADIRVAAMKESLEAIGRFDPDRARDRFLSKFDADNTKVVRSGGRIIAFYVIQNKTDHLYLDHLYVHPEYQSKGIGGEILRFLIVQSSSLSKNIKLGALKGSRANDFYRSFGFVKSHEREFDNFYELRQN